MLELGRHAAAAHREIAEIVLALDNIDMVVAVGHHMLNAAELLMREWPHERCEIVGDLTPEQARRIASLLRPDDTVLVKGSRRMRLERIIEAINTGSTTSTAPEGAARRKSA
jgi:UDP-N-acetylmuramoyl-tripeptide--D-alanyl-D-alanine ligase